MKASELIFALHDIIVAHGDLTILSGPMKLEEPIGQIILIDKNGCIATEENTKPVNIFLTQ